VCVLGSSFELQNYFQLEIEINTNQKVNMTTNNNKKTKYEELEEKEKKITSALDIPNLKEKVDKHIKTFPIDVMTNTLSTKLVEEKETNWSDDSLRDKNTINKMTNWFNYYKQIENNLIVGAKAIFLVCRDLEIASRKLSSEDYELLKKKVHLSESTINKYVAIGKSTTCSELFQLNRLPESWTTMYRIASLEKKDDKKPFLKTLKENVNLDTTCSDVDVFMEVVKNTIKPLYTYENLESPKDFIRVAFDSKTTVDPNALSLLKKEVEKVVYQKINEFNSKNKGYFLTKDDEKPIAVEVATNTKVLDKVLEKATEFLSKIKGKDKKTKMTESMTAFKKVRQEIENPILSKLGA